MATEFVYALAPELLLLALVVALMLLEMLRADPRWARLGMVATSAAALSLLLQQLGDGYAAAVLPGEIEIGRFAHPRPDGAAAVHCRSSRSRFGPGRGYKFWMLAAASMLGGMVMVASTGFAPLFVGIELLSLPAFALIVQGQGRSVASEGAFKYLVLSSIASATFLFGVSLSYGLTGTLAVGAWSHAFQFGGLQGKAAGLLVLAGCS